MGEHRETLGHLQAKFIAAKTNEERDEAHREATSRLTKILRSSSKKLEDALTIITGGFENTIPKFPHHGDIVVVTLKVLTNLKYDKKLKQQQEPRVRQPEDQQQEAGSKNGDPPPASSNTNPNPPCTKGASQAGSELVRKQKLRAFHLFTSASASGYSGKAQMVCSAFELDDFSLSDAYLETVGAMVRDGRVAEASAWTACLKLPLLMPTLNFCFYLVVGRQVWLLEEYVKERQGGLDVPSLIKELDSLMDGRKRSSLFPNERTLNFDEKSVRKLLTKLCAQYDLKPEAACPTMCRGQVINRLQYMIRSTFSDKTMSLDAFREVVTLIIEESPFAREATLEFLGRCKKTPSEAARLAVELELDQTTFPEQVRESIAVGNYDEVSRALCVIRNADFYKLTLDPSQVLMVETVDDFKKAVNCILEKSDVVGIDCEWYETEVDMSLLQLAIRDCVYLFDLRALKASIDKECGNLLMRVFSSPDILKIGYAISGDWRALGKVCQPLTKIGESCVNVLDFHFLTNHILDLEPYSSAIFPRKPDKKFSGGLANLVNEVLGKPLDKREQVSNWNRRPLRPAQLEYAALDAYCLIEIYDRCKERIEKAGLDLKRFQKMCVEKQLDDETLQKKEKSEKDRNRLPHALHKKKVASSNSSAKAEAPRTGQLVQVTLPKINGSLLGEPPRAAWRPSEQIRPRDNPRAVGASAGPQHNIRHSDRGGLKIVLDFPLRKQNRPLRRLGLDSIALKDYSNREQCLRELNSNEGRVILVSDEDFDEMKDKFPDNACYSVGLNQSNYKRVLEIVETLGIPVPSRTHVYKCCQESFAAGDDLGRNNFAPDHTQRTRVFRPVKRLNTD